MELHEIGAFIQSQGKASFVLDGKIDTTKFAYPVEIWSSGNIPHTGDMVYGVDESYRELYNAIERPVDFRLIDNEEDWFHEQKEIRGYRRNK